MLLCRQPIVHKLLFTTTTTTNTVPPPASHPSLTSNPS